LDRNGKRAQISEFPLIRRYHAAQSCPRGTKRKGVVSG
jgi:hypothetical protein